MSSRPAPSKSNSSPPARRSGFRLFSLSCLGLESSSGIGRTRRIVNPENTQSSNRQINPDSTQCSSRQIYWRNNLLDFSDIEVERQIRSEVLGMINSHYKKVNLRLVFDAGFCFGLLDPVSNIIINTLIGTSLPKDNVPQSEAVPDRWLFLERDRIADMGERSLMGLVAFLTYLFPYLADSKATRYLHNSKADPLVAAQLILNDRGCEKSFWSAATIKTAMLCAATAGQHPNPQQFMLGWKVLLSNLQELVGVLSAATLSLDSIIELLLNRPLESESSATPFLENSDVWSLAASRSVNLNHEMSFPGRDTMRRMLLTMIHGFYLKALAMLPKEELCSSLHCCMLEAGHCYGPLDPVSNIILNTILYHATTFSPSKRKVPEISMLSTRGLLQIAVQSFYGLVSYMCTCNKNITPDVALRRLQTFLLGVPTSDSEPDDNNRAQEVAYDAAAVAAHHPYPNAQNDFFRSSNSASQQFAKERLRQRAQSKSKLSSDDVQFLSCLALDSCSVVSQEQPAAKLDSWSYAALERDSGNFWAQHDRITRMVKSALNRYNMEHGGTQYELHVICGVNEHVKCLEDSIQAINNHGHYIPENKYTYQCSHINFLATCMDPGSSAVLFFAEWSNNSAEESGYCCVVSEPFHRADRVRCFYCECSGSRIVHPSDMNFHGDGLEFVKVLGRGRLFASEWSNDSIISKSSAVTHWMYGLEDDSIYCTAILDEEKEEHSILGAEKEHFDKIMAKGHLLDNL